MTAPLVLIALLGAPVETGSCRLAEKGLFARLWSFNSAWLQVAKDAHEINREAGAIAKRKPGYKRAKKSFAMCEVSCGSEGEVLQFGRCAFFANSTG